MSFPTEENQHEAFTANVPNGNQTAQEIKFDSDSIQTTVDSGSSKTYWCHEEHFKDLVQLSETERHKMPIRVANDQFVYPKAIGTLVLRIDDDLSVERTIEVYDALLVPEIPQTLFCPQQWARQREEILGDNVAHSDIKGRNIRMEWKDPNTDEVYCKTIPYDPRTNVGKMTVNAGFDHYLAFACKLCSDEPLVCMAAPNQVSDDNDGNEESDETSVSSTASIKLISNPPGPRLKQDPSGPPSSTPKGALFSIPRSKGNVI
jgi:hypothetical protein